MSVVLCSLLLPAGCGGGDRLPIDPNVKDGATRVSILTVFEATTSYDLNPASVTGETVRMIDGKGFPVAAEVSYDEDAHVIRLRPLQPLVYDETYQWQIAGVQARDGEVPDSVTVEFKTYVNHLTRSIYYEYDYELGTPVITGHIDDVREDGQYVGYDWYWDPGMDGQWLTQDDELFIHTRYTFDTLGRYHRAIDYGSDDNVRSYWEYTYDSNGNMDKRIRYRWAGGDGEWFTDDDEILTAYVYKYLEDGRLEMSSRYTLPGPDGLTEYVSPDSYSLWVYDERGMPARILSFTGYGLDGIWETSDDVLGGYSVPVHDDRRLAIEWNRYGDRGEDDEWFTADDRQHSFSSITYDQRGNRIERVEVEGSGLDDQWGTQDDNIVVRQEYDTSN